MLRLSNAILSIGLLLATTTATFAQSTDVLLPPEVKAAAQREAAKPQLPPVPAGNNDLSVLLPKSLTTPAPRISKKPGGPKDPRYINSKIGTKIIDVTGYAPRAPRPGVLRPAPQSAITINTTPYVFSDNDRTLVARRFGILPSAVDSACIIQRTGKILTTKGAYQFQINTPMSGEAMYDGTITRVTMDTSALCALQAQPAKAGPIIKSGDKYLMVINAQRCQLPAPATGKHLNITPSGFGSATCSVQ